MPIVWKTRSDGVRQRFRISPLRKDVIKLYKSGLASRKVGEKLGISHARVLKILELEKVERRSVIKPVLNPDFKKLTPERAYILGVMCGDGCVFSGIEYKKHWSYKSYVVYLSVRDKDFIDEFVRNIKEVYGFNPSIHYRIRKKDQLSNIWTSRIKRKRIWEDLQKYNFGGSDWNVPKEILKSSNEEIIGSFLRGFYDSEGSVIVGKRGAQISVCSTSRGGIEQIRKLVNGIGIKTSALNKCEKGRSKPLYYFIITHRENYIKYLNRIGFSIKRKEDKILGYLGGLNRKNKNSFPCGSDIQLAS